MPNLVQKPDYRAKLGRHGHDLSRRVLFTSSVGQLLPVLYDFLSPGDQIRINSNMFTRTQPLNTAAFVRITEHIDYFFVPMDQIDPYFNNSFFGINDFHNTNDLSYSASDKSSSSVTPPLLDYSIFSPNQLKSCLLASRANTNGESSGSLYSYWKDPDSNATYGILPFTVLASGDEQYPSSVYGSFCDPFGIPKLFNAIRLLDMLGYGSNILGSTPAVNAGGAPGAIYMNTRLLQVYQKIFFDWYRLSDFQNNYPAAYNSGYINRSNNTPAVFDFYTIYTYNDNDANPDVNYNGMLCLRYRPFKKDFFTNVQRNPLFDIQNSYGAYAQGVSSTTLPKSINSRVMSSLGMNMQDLANTVVSRYGGDVELGLQDNDVFLQNSPSPSDSSVPSISLANLRAAYAYERMLMITQRGGRHYEDQVRAHFGINVPQGVSGECYYLGSHSNTIKIGEVVATAAGSVSDSSSVLGEIGGRGIGATGKQKRISFRAPCHGYLMAIYSAVPEVDYTDEGVYRPNLYVNVMDFPHPEFDNLGMQPLYYLQSYMGSWYQPNGAYSGINPNLIVGWQYRWTELKQSFDVVHGAFLHTLRDWVAVRRLGDFYQFNIASSSGNISDTPITSLNWLYSFYISPRYLDGLFALTFSPTIVDITSQSSDFDNSNRALIIQSEDVLYSPTGASVTAAQVPENGEKYNNNSRWNSSVVYQRDPLLHSLDFKYYKTSWMSARSMPRI